MKSLIGWTATACTLGGVTAQSLLPGHLAWSFVVFLIGNLFWLVNGYHTKNRPLIALQVVCIGLNINALRHFT